MNKPLSAMGRNELIERIEALESGLRHALQAADNLSEIINTYREPLEDAADLVLSAVDAVERCRKLLP